MDKEIRSDQLYHPAGMIADKQDHSLIIADDESKRVVRWLNRQSEILVDNIDYFGQIYVTDWGNHRVVRWCEGRNKGEIVVDGKEEGAGSNQLNIPCGLSLDFQRNLYVDIFAQMMNLQYKKLDI